MVILEENMSNLSSNWRNKDIQNSKTKEETKL